MHTKKLMTLLLAVVLVLSLAACGAKGGDHMDGMDNEPKTAEEAAAMHKELTAQEAAILAENTALWEKVFMAADKGRDSFQYRSLGLQFLRQISCRRFRLW